MPDAEPGRVTPAPGWPGTWTTITRGEYHEIIAAAGGLEGLALASSCTHPHGRNYVLTAWARPGEDRPLVQSELDGCDVTVPWDQCPGTHAYSKFTCDPALEDSDAG